MLSPAERGNHNVFGSEQQLPVPVVVEPEDEQQHPPVPQSSASTTPTVDSSVMHKNDLKRFFIKYS